MEVVHNHMSINAARKKIGLKSSTAKLIISRYRIEMQRNAISAN
jgi:hypothetical protein